MVFRGIAGQASRSYIISCGKRMTNTLQQLAGQVDMGNRQQHWNPPYSGHLDLRIKRNGQWVYQGQPIVREGLVRLFAGILRQEQGCYYLVTPVEKYSIDVDLLPFVSQQLEICDRGPHQEVVVTSNTGEQLILGEQCPLYFHAVGSDESVPCIRMHDGLGLLLQRSHFYQLVQVALEQGNCQSGLPGILSSGKLFALHV